MSDYREHETSYRVETKQQAGLRARTQAAESRVQALEQQVARIQEWAERVQDGAIFRRGVTNIDTYRQGCLDAATDLLSLLTAPEQRKEDE